MFLREKIHINIDYNIIFIVTWLLNEFLLILKCHVSKFNRKILIVATIGSKFLNPKNKKSKILKLKALKFISHK